YVTKPFQSRELVARIRAQARRGRGDAGPRAERLELGVLVIDNSTMQVTVRGKPVSLTTAEFQLLHILAQRAGRVLGREQLLLLIAITAVVIFIAEGPHAPARPDEHLNPALIHHLEDLDNDPRAVEGALADLRDHRIEASIYDHDRKLVASNVDPPLAIPER